MNNRADVRPSRDDIIITKTRQTGLSDRVLFSTYYRALGSSKRRWWTSGLFSLLFRHMKCRNRKNRNRVKLYARMVKKFYDI